MAKIELIDTSLRDANQSLWGAVGLDTAMAVQLAEALGEVGYACAELITSSTMSTAVRYQREDPWARIDGIVRSMPGTKLGFLTTGKRFISWHRTPDPIFELAFQLLVKHGVRRLWIIDPMNVMGDAARMAVMARAAGFEEIIVGLVYSLSPIHTDAYYCDCALHIDAAAQGAIDGLYIKDPGGLLTPERLASLVPAIRSGLTHLEIREIHSHCNTGLAPRVLLDAADLGIRGLHCALDPVANGASHSPATMLVKNLRSRGHDVVIDDDALARACNVVEDIARQHGLPLGLPAIYDEGYFHHQIPGGVLSTMARQLAEIGQIDLIPAIKREVVRVRADMGFPIMVTPFSQYLVTQATMNVLTGRRYERIPDEIVPLLCGDFGPLPGRVNPELLEQALARKHDMTMSEESIPELRKRLGEHLSDEELLLRSVMPVDQVDAMVNRNDRSDDFATAVIDLLHRDKDGDIDVAVGNARFSLTRKNGRRNR